MTPEVKTEIISHGHDFSMFGLFFQADPIVKGVMIFLFFLSICCWAIFINKTITFRKEKKSQQEFEELFWSGIDLQNLFGEVKHNHNDSFSPIFVVGMNELMKSQNIFNEKQLVFIVRSCFSFQKLATYLIPGCVGRGVR